MKSKKRWLASIIVKYKEITTSHKNKEEAIASRRRLELIHYGFHP